jgi:hypothetical protein
MNPPDSTRWLSALAPTRQAAGSDESLAAPSIALNLTLDRASGRVCIERSGERIERSGERIELAGLSELTRYLESLARETPVGTPRGLR